MSDIGDILQKATQVLDAKGWCQNELYNWHTGTVCLYGAINTALTGSWNCVDWANIAVISNALYDHLPEPYKKGSDISKPVCIVNFNNDSHTTVIDVKDLFAKTIADEGISIDQ